MKILSLFDGMSVAQQALKEAGIPVDVYYASEIDEYAKAVTQSNFPDTIQIGDVENIIASEYAISRNDRSIIYPFGESDGVSITKTKIDLLIGGSPCQDLSIAKANRKGLDGSRSGLFWEYVRIRDEVKPKYFILENVNSMPKEAKEVISEALGVQPIMINASLVSAQNRKRLFWVGKYSPELDKYEPIEIPQPEDRRILLKDVLEENVDEKYFVLNKDGSEKLKSNTVRTSGRGSGIDDKHNWDTIRIGSLNSGGQGDRIYSKEGKSVSLSANGGGRGAKTGLYHIPHGYKKEEITKVDKYPTLCGQDPRTKHLLYPQIRKLTPTECLRLQSMPDNYFDKAIYKKKPISNTQRYKMCGNAFNCEVIVHILKHLK